LLLVYILEGARYNQKKLLIFGGFKAGAQAATCFTPVGGSENTADGGAKISP
jgi:hypothetical protein